MEESISGGRKKSMPAPPPAGSPHGNAKTLSLMGILSDDEGMGYEILYAGGYIEKADLQDKFWNSRHLVLRQCLLISSPDVRGLSDIYLGIFKLPDTVKRYEVAWKVMDENGFLLLTD